MGRFSAVTLQKNETINLSKVDNETPLKKAHVGLGWDVHNSINADLDAFVLQLDGENKEIDTLYFGSNKVNGQLQSKDAAMIHTGDNLTGEGDGDDEVILIDFDALNPHTKRLLIAVNIYQARLTFNDIENAFIRLLNAQNGELIAHYNLSQELGKNYSMILGEFSKLENGTWDFKAIGKGTKDQSISSLVREYSKGKSNKTISVERKAYVPINQETTATQSRMTPQKKSIFARLFNRR